MKALINYYSTKKCFITIDCFTNLSRNVKLKTEGLGGKWPNHENLMERIVYPNEAVFALFAGNPEIAGSLNEHLLSIITDCWGGPYVRRARTADCYKSKQHE